MSNKNIKEAFAIESKHSAFYTGGNVKWSKDGEHLFCLNNGTLSVLSISTGLVVNKLGNSEDEDIDVVNTFCVSNDGNQVITSHKSSLFKLWTWKDEKLVKHWKSIHQGPIPLITFFGNDIMASGGSDSSVRLWNLQHHSCTHNLKGLIGVVSVLEFHPDAQMQLLFAAGDDKHEIFGWDITTGQLTIRLKAHLSKVTSLSFHNNGINLVSSGRDKVLILWDITQQVSIRVLPVFEGIEGAFIIPANMKLPIDIDEDSDDKIFVASAGQKGTVKIWEMKSGREVYCQNNSLVPAAEDKDDLSITHLLLNEQVECFAVVTTDHHILIHALKSFVCTKQFVGYTDEILDIVYVGENGSHIAVATNSWDIKLYELATMNCQLLRGHTEIVLALATTPANRYLMVSSAKDNSVRVWLMCKESHMMFCIGHSERHTASVGSVALSQSSANFFASVSQDRCLKLWSLPKKLSTTDKNIDLNVEHTVVGHEQKSDINCVVISPNDKIIATGSQDKTAKLWSADNLQLIGVLRGHRRGVWCVRFSPIDQVLMTTSADCTIKLWSISELNCLKTFEGHESSVMRGEFISRGMQLITSGADGLLKLWIVKTSEAITTLEAHTSRVWTLAVSEDENHIISGGSDSQIVVWRDVTVENRNKMMEEKEKLIIEEQKLSNLLKADELVAALKLALKLDKPMQVLRVIEGIMKNSDSEKLKDAISELKPHYKESLLKCASTWNTNSRNAQPAQLIINILMNDIGSGAIQMPSLSSSLEALIPYTDRHLKRLTRLFQDLHLLNYTVNRIKPHNEPKKLNGFNE
ncbi:transducin beta-like protein 3 [Microplitis mediator]|uniref:transducin beta-like protein 3 n=1 Tax=Microplitis mediator TaxID=375433 RepID=UPI002552376D|nr:transducin beta-like protein 3 [Microplitis mediator]